MDDRTSRMLVLFLIVGVLGVMTFYSVRNESEWDSARESVHMIEEDRSDFDQQWQVYRQATYAHLERMSKALETARSMGSVADRKELDGLEARIQGLYDDIEGELEIPSDQSSGYRNQVEADFLSLRSDIDALLTRIGFNPDEIASWHEER